MGCGGCSDLRNTFCFQWLRKVGVLALLWRFANVIWDLHGCHFLFQTFQTSDCLPDFKESSWNTQMPVLYSVLVADVMSSERTRIWLVVVAATGETQFISVVEQEESLGLRHTWHRQIFRYLTKRLRAQRHPNHPKTKYNWKWPRNLSWGVRGLKGFWANPEIIAMPLKKKTKSSNRKQILARACARS